MKVRAAVYDLGSSSFHLLVCEVGDEIPLVPVLRRRAWLHLGASLVQSGGIPKERVRAALAAARRLRSALESAHPDVVVALATAALRDATNGDEVVQRLEHTIDRPIEVLDGGAEARLCFAGQVAGVFTNGRPTLGIDLGGGSLELAVGTARSIEVATSVPIGAARLRSELAVGDVMTERDREQVRLRTLNALEELRPSLARPDVSSRTLLSGGTARALARIAVRHARRAVDPAAGTATVNQVELPAAQVAQLADRLGARELRSRLDVPGMNPKRAAVLPVGAAILAVTADVLGISHYVVSEWGLREGALLNALEHA